MVRVSESHLASGSRQDFNALVAGMTKDCCNFLSVIPRCCTRAWTVARRYEQLSTDFRTFTYGCDIATMLRQVPALTLTGVSSTPPAAVSTEARRSTC